MATFINQTKNTSTFTNTVKNVSSFSNTGRTHNLYYILTDALDFVLLGQNEDEFLVLDLPTEWNNQTKN